MAEQDKQLPKSPMKDSTVQEHWEETPPHPKAPVLLSGFVPCTPILIYCNELVSVAILVLQNGVDVTLGTERHRRQRSFSQLCA